MDEIKLGDCEVLLKEVPSDSIDAVITDPPYGLGTKEPTIEAIDRYLSGESALDTGGDFMGAAWTIPSVPIWREAYRVLKPGGYLLSFGGTRSFDLIEAGIHQAGFEKVMLFSWIYSQGFPKSRDILERDIKPEIEQQLRKQGVIGEIRWRR